ncbi:MAG TPA: HU family DNA-binding protein [Desulfomonilia bacterium]|nr:HU family DNA-binding protein [Desulfomonilia bacterium]
MKKSDLIKEIAGNMHIHPDKAEAVVNTILNAMAVSLKKGDRVEIRGFGHFDVKDYKAYTGRNPRTGEKIEVKPKRLPFFKAGKDLKEQVNASKRTT